MKEIKKDFKTFQLLNLKKDSKFNFYPIWSLIEYYHIIYQFKYKILIDRIKMFKLILYFVTHYNEQNKFKLNDICRYVLNIMFPSVHYPLISDFYEFSENKIYVKKISSI